MTLATGAPRRVGLASAREGARCFYTDLVDDAAGPVRHAVERYGLVVQALGGAYQEEARFYLPIAETERSWARSLLRDRPRPWLAVGVGARGLTKRWPPESFATLLRMALATFGGTAIFVGSREEISLSRKAASLLPGPALDVTGRTTLPQLAALLSLADVMIANDTGPLHMAVALGRPIVAPYTCTQVRRTGPFGQGHRAVETAVWCRGSYVKQCERLECMEELSPERLWPPLQQVLATWQRQNQSA
jgi:ADP-heptose:LPS heptosyltransferase